MVEKKKSSPKKYKIIVSLCCVGVMILSFLGGFFLNSLIQGKTMNTLSWVVGMVDKYYYDETDGVVKQFTYDDYAKALMKGATDDYSDYYTPEEYADVIKTSQGNNYGTGISLLRNPKDENDTTIYRVAGNSPAWKVGLLDGDKVIKFTVGGDETPITTAKGLSAFLSGIGDEEFTITVERSDGQHNFTLKKAVFIKSFVYYYDNQNILTFESQGEAQPVESVNPHDNLVMQGLDDDSAYINLSNFDGGASSQFAVAMDYLKERGKTKLILDLRRNGGGYMSILSEIASYTLYSDDNARPVIAIAKDKNANKEYFIANANKFNTDIVKIVAIADGDTASASECLLGAMLHYGKAFSIDNLVLEGEATYGKGIMQTTYTNFLTGEAIKLTTAKIYQPDGVTSIHGVGITTTPQNTVGLGEGLEKAISLINA